MELSDLVFIGTDPVPNGFTLLKDFDGYCINREGVVYDLYENVVLVPEIDDKGYWAYLMPRTCRFPFPRRYRLLAETYIPLPLALIRSAERFVVNHINGIKIDDSLDNLEWTTYKGNLEHAGDMGLSPKCYPIKVYEIRTATETVYPSATEYARQNKLTKDAILWRLRTDGQRIFEGRLYKHAHSRTPWTTETAEHQSVFGMTRKVDVKWVLTGKEVTYDSCKEAAAAIGCGQPAICEWLKLPGQRVFPGYVQVKLHNPTVGFRPVYDPVTELAEHSKDKPVVRIDVKAGTATIYDSIGKAAKAAGVGVTTLHYRLNHNKGANWGGFKFVYYSEFTGSATVATL